MHTLDLVIIFVYLIAITAFGIWYAATRLLNDAAGDLRVALVVGSTGVDHADALAAVEKTYFMVDASIRKLNWEAH